MLYIITVFAIIAAAFAIAYDLRKNGFTQSVIKK
jgi:hypothetical protein